MISLIYVCNLGTDYPAADGAAYIPLRHATKMYMPGTTVDVDSCRYLCAFYQFRIKAFHSAVMAAGIDNGIHCASSGIKIRFRPRTLLDMD